MALAFSLVAAPAAAAYASDDLTAATIDQPSSVQAEEQGQQEEPTSAAVSEALDSYASEREKSGDAAQAEAIAKAEKAAEVQAEAEAKAKAKAEAKAKARAAKEIERKYSKVLSYDRKLLAKIGTQESTGHTICCPSFSCAYADCVIDGTVHDHSYYTCSCCTWTDWGGGGSWNRSVGSNEQLLREAHDQIDAGKPTVIHVTGGTGEHWICLIGYKSAVDPDHLTLDNFVALDPWDGAEIIASERWSLYGDGCEHISTR